MKAAVMSVHLRDEVMESYRELAKLQGVTLSKVFDEVLDEYFEMGSLQCDIEACIEQQTGVEVSPLPEVSPEAKAAVRRMIGTGRLSVPEPSQTQN